MRNLIFSCMFLLSAAFASAQTGGSLESIGSALNSGDVTALSKFFADNVEISIQDKEQTYPKAKAAEVIRSFFGSNHPKSFNQVHKGSSRANSDQYCIGHLMADNGTYRVYLYLKVAGSNLLIQEMRFDKE